MIEASFESIPHSTELGTRPALRDPVRPEKRSCFCEATNFFISAPKEQNFCILVDQALSCVFYSSCKCSKQFLWIFFHLFPKTFFGRSFHMLFWFTYPGYKLHALLRRQLFTNISLVNEIIYIISRFHAIYSSFMQYFIRFVFHIKCSC